MCVLSHMMCKTLQPTQPWIVVRCHWLSLLVGQMWRTCSSICLLSLLLLCSLSAPPPSTLSGCQLAPGSISRPFPHSLCICCHGLSGHWQRNRGTTCRWFLVAWHTGKICFFIQSRAPLVVLIWLLWRSSRICSWYTLGITTLSPQRICILAQLIVHACSSRKSLTPPYPRVLANLPWSSHTPLLEWDLCVDIAMSFALTANSFTIKKWKSWISIKVSCCVSYCYG